MGGQEEEALRRRFRAKGLHLMLKEEMSAVNKKIDVRLKVASLHAFLKSFEQHLNICFQARSGFTRTKLLETLNGVTSLPNHVIEVLKVMPGSTRAL
jgi:hypothetical protein